ncbi:ribonucleotide reductase inhibitor [Colletotrichum karsti]|uniref:Ribonucleotide reductase inhibitor n=1 Tax=Colletotrichum karsti TaxID=1095194 RepID=A0A9P6IAH0_9PEZI|nr:ribonucleotide reductase inhibitor [Colletotrichum karsti]KAF9875035.1 ribonucleotide reductase inhibitor [Colletotrichum karsti]
MSAPRTKRPFAGASVDPSQRQITSFFTTRPGPAPAGPSPTPAETNNIPSEVQSNLLSVGMRIRKSVPEGYKTGTYSSFKLWSESASAPTVVRTTPSTTSRKQRSAASSQRELMPFCGINKIGGLSSQPVTEDNDSDDAEVPGLDDMPGLSSSQESVESVDSMDSVETTGDGRSRKRIFDDRDDSDEPVQMWVDRSAWMEGEVSPRSLAPSGWANARTLAVPRKSRRGKPMGQENVVDDDFEDADFLVTPDTDMSDA